MKRSAPVVHSDPEILGGTPVFVGTRVPVQSLFDYSGAVRLWTSSCTSSPLSSVNRPSQH